MSANLGIDVGDRALSSIATPSSAIRQNDRAHHRTPSTSTAPNGVGRTPSSTGPPLAGLTPRIGSTPINESPSASEIAAKAAARGAERLRVNGVSAETGEPIDAAGSEAVSAAQVTVALPPTPPPLPQLPPQLPPKPSVLPSVPAGQQQPPATPPRGIPIPTGHSSLLGNGGYSLNLMQQPAAQPPQPAPNADAPWLTPPPPGSLQPPPRDSNPSVASAADTGAGGSSHRSAASRAAAIKARVIPFSEVSLKKEIGKGSYGVVHHGVWCSTDVAVKVWMGFQAEEITDVSGQRDMEMIADELEREAGLMQDLRHPNICMMLGVCVNPPAIVQAR